MTSKDEMLERVRRALGHAKPGDRIPSNALPEIGTVLPPTAPETPQGPNRLVDQFENELRAVSGACHRADSVVQLQDILEQILPPSEGAAIALSRNPLLARLNLAERLAARNRTITRWLPTAAVHTSEWTDFRRACFAARAGITGVDLVLAESGTLVLSSETEGSQLASLAPPVHIALYSRAQVVESLEEALARLRPASGQNKDLGSRSLVFITGPSRTADIEQVSIRGVHGPVQVHAILIEESCVTGEPHAGNG